jgi:ATP-binding protein involved in chromosome partitioning
MADAQILSALRSVPDPELGQDLVSLEMVRGAEIRNGIAEIQIELTTPACPHRDAIAVRVAEAVDRAIPGTRVRIDWTARVRDGRRGGGLRAQPLPGLDGVRNIVLVASGKGGVGKSTVASNLACALARTGARTGLLDADIYGPSIPTMFDAHEEVFSKDGKTIEPLRRLGLALMSMGFFVGPEKAMIWRGPMLDGAVTQFLRDVAWGELDYLLVDLPPGTGDVQLSFAQKLRVSGALIVSTPQEVALADVVRAHAMFESVRIPVLGLIENMSYFQCDGCGKRHPVFDHGGARMAAERLGVPFLGELPLDLRVRVGGDRGMPVVEAEPDSESAREFVRIARDLAAKMAIIASKPAPEEPGQAATSAAGKRSLPIVG